MSFSQLDPHAAALHGMSQHDWTYMCLNFAAMAEDCATLTQGHTLTDTRPLPPQQPSLLNPAFDHFDSQSHFGNESEEDGRNTNAERETFGRDYLMQQSQAPNMGEAFDSTQIETQPPRVSGLSAVSNAAADSRPPSSCGAPDKTHMIINAMSPDRPDFSSNIERSSPARRVKRRRIEHNVQMQATPAATTLHGQGSSSGPLRDEITSPVLPQTTQRALLHLFGKEFRVIADEARQVNARIDDKHLLQWLINKAGDSSSSTIGQKQGLVHMKMAQSDVLGPKGVQVRPDILSRLRWHISLKAKGPCRSSGKGNKGGVPRPLECLYKCQASFKDRGAFKKHHRQRKPQKLQICSELDCEKVVHLTEELRNHLRVQHKVVGQDLDEKLMQSDEYTIQFHELCGFCPDEKIEEFYNFDEWFKHVCEHYEVEHDAPHASAWKWRSNDSLRKGGKSTPSCSAKDDPGDIRDDSDDHEDDDDRDQRKRQKSALQRLNFPEGSQGDETILQAGPSPPNGPQYQYNRATASYAPDAKGRHLADGVREGLRRKPFAKNRTFPVAVSDKHDRDFIGTQFNVRHDVKRLFESYVSLWRDSGAASWVNGDIIGKEYDVTLLLAMSD